MAKVPSHEKIELAEEAKLVEDYTIQTSDRAESLVEARKIDDQSVTARTMAIAQTVADKYEILEKLGAGGMSTVYKVKHLHLNKILALKLLQKANDLSSVQRFQQEAKASSLLEHPSIVRVYDFGITPDGMPFMTMDYLQGRSLSEILKQDGALNTARITRIFGQICLALAHAHALGVVHRDIKPSNIMIIGDSIETEQAILVDFGIAKIISEGDDNLTRTGDIFGTPTYMSPEQCQGQRVDARSDVYSLGCVMYEAVTGNPPFQAESVYHLIHKQITEAPAAFPDSVRKTQSGRKLEALVLKAMAKAPSDRHKFILELSSELKAIEFGDTGVWGELGAVYRIFNARLRATERQSMLTKSILKFGSLVALFLALALSILPIPISIAGYEHHRNLAIVNYCTKISSDRFEENPKTDFWLTPIEPYLAGLVPLCQNDKMQSHYLNLLIRRSKESGDSCAAIQNGINNMQFNTMDTLKDLMGSTRITVTKWAKANKTCNKLADLSIYKKVQAQHQIDTLWNLTILCRVLAIVTEVLLLVAIVKRFIGLRTESIDEPKLGRLPPAPTNTGTIDTIS